DYCQLRALGGWVLLRLLPGVSLVHMGQFDRLTSDLLDLLGQPLDIQHSKARSSCTWHHRG
ncbi:MAG TPA: hypothetical protein PLG21_06650, partial [Anaerolineae bacterium]|nr:hypothetical protein [Anaerolineae bacterium]